MTNEQLLAKFNPANGDNLTPEDLEILRGLTDEQIDKLADAYPNTPTRRAYLRLYDDKLPADKQLYQLSTWQNLRNVRKFANQKHLKPFDFVVRGKVAARPVTVNLKPSNNASKKVTVDLTAQQAANELKEALTVDKKTQTAKTSEGNRGTKTNAGKSSKANKAAAAAKPAPVDNGGTPADQEFTDGGGE